MKEVKLTSFIVQKWFTYSSLSCSNALMCMFHWFCNFLTIANLWNRIRMNTMISWGWVYIYIIHESLTCSDINIPGKGICRSHWGRSSPCDPLWICPLHGGAWHNHICKYSNITAQLEVNRSKHCKTKKKFYIMIFTWLWHFSQGSEEYPFQRAGRKDFWSPVDSEKERRNHLHRICFQLPPLMLCYNKSVLSPGIVDR